MSGASIGMHERIACRTLSGRTAASNSAVASLLRMGAELRYAVYTCGCERTLLTRKAKLPSWAAY